MMAALPYMQFYVADYLADTSHLTTEEHGAYMLLLFSYWQTGKPLRIDRLSTIARVPNSDILSLSALTTALTIEQGGTGKKTAGEAIQALGGVRLGVGNSSIGTSLISGAPPGIASINQTNNEGKTALRISNDANNNASAVMTFIRDTAFGVHLGLDTDNKFKLGGFSMGNVARTLYHEGNIVGTVSQTGGIPTGAIVEEGSNNNGSYVKFASGLMICRGVSANALAVNTAGGSLFHSGNNVSFTFPFSFVGAFPSVTLNVVTAGSYYCWAAVEGQTTVNSVTARVVSPVSGTSGYVCYTAIGRWFA
ncbi:Prophage PSPPH04 [Pseudomonas syringae pv. maculicola]|nr:Prophage PSPPH04 [Pseudomonas syringae pv. maculicola]